MSYNIIGISAFFHDSACCLLQDGRLTAAAEEERFTRIKADPSIPKYAFRYCLQQAKLRINDIDCVAYYEDPQKKLDRQLWCERFGQKVDVLTRSKPRIVENTIREMLGYDGPVFYTDHHMSHAASSFFYSGFDEAAILTADGVGEWATTTYGSATRNKLELFEEVRFPDSLGLLYSTITSYLGFGVNDGEYKVMGLAPYGQPRYVDKIRALVIDADGGQFNLDMRFFEFVAGRRMYSGELIDLLGNPARREDDDILTFHTDIARSMQVVLEEILIKKCHYLHQRTHLDNLCMAGGVALNCVANGKILREGPFTKMFVQPAANDAGGAIGAAAIAHLQLTGEAPFPGRMTHAYLGPSFSSETIYKLIRATGLKFTDLRNNRERLLYETAERIREGKVIGWFQGRMEFGPRSLGARSILADPRGPDMRNRINKMVKKREGFRPFAPAVLDYKAKDHFDIDHDSPFMLETCRVISPLALPAITHIDGSARVQTVAQLTNPSFYGLLEAFDKLTGCPILLNTSFNVKGEPIVCTPEDALRCFITADIDSLVIGDYIIDRKDNNLDVLRYVLIRDYPAKDGIVHNVYTFL